MTSSRLVRLLASSTVFLMCALSFAQAPDEFLRGGDVSEIPQVEAAGGHYSYHGKQEDPFVIMRQAGWNFVRLRIWNAPKDGWCDKQHTLAMAIRAAEQGLKISLDFHYSDWWADPGKQNKPAAWKDLPFDQLVKAVYAYTKDVVSAMIDQGTPPYMVQCGNEIISGMLWPDGRVSGNDPGKWKPLLLLLESGFKAVHDVAGPNKILTMVHLDRGGDNRGATWWFDNAIADGLKFDAIGLSYYPFWHGNIHAMQANVDELARRYGKDIYIVETGYPWTMDARSQSGEHVLGSSRGILPDYPATPDAQSRFIAKLIEVLRKIPDGHGRGLLYWAPMWISPGKEPTPYDNVALFNYAGDSLPALDTLGGTPAAK